MTEVQGEVLEEPEELSSDRKLWLEPSVCSSYQRETVDVV